MPWSVERVEPVRRAEPEQLGKSTPALVMSCSAETILLEGNSAFFSTGTSSSVCLRAPPFAASSLIDANELGRVLHANKGVTFS